MKKRIVFVGILSMMMLGTTATSCSSDDNGYEELAKGSVDVVVGTYVGTLNANIVDADASVWYDAVILVTKDGEGRMKVSAQPGQPYSSVTPKTFTVESSYIYEDNTYDVLSLIGSLEGYFTYTGANKNLSIFTHKQSETDVSYSFEGTKQ